jgi:hypothetical protein
MRVVPTSVFKYVTAERLDIILNQRIAFTPPNRFNDLFDVRPEVKPVTDAAFLRKHAKEAERKFLKSLPRNQRPRNKRQRSGILRGLRAGAVQHFQGQAQGFAASQEAQLQDEISKVFGILCFSEVSPDDPDDADLMWAYYADSHRGFVIEFDTAHPAIQALGNLEKVEYLPHRPIYDAVEAAKGFWRQKPNKWGYEREWRISRLLDECEQRRVKDITIYLSPLSRASIKAVYLGLRSDGALENKVRGALSGTNAIPYRGYVETGSSKLAFQKL